MRQKMLSLFFKMSVILIVCLTLFGACKKETPTIEEKIVTYTAVVDTLPRIALTKEAKEQLVNFPEMESLQKAIDSLYTDSKTPFQDQIKKVKERSRNFQELLPPKLRINTVISRSNVLITKAGRSEQDFIDQAMTQQRLAQKKQEVIVAYNNLIIQVNEVYLEIPENIAKELLLESQNLADSVSAAVPN